MQKAKSIAARTQEVFVIKNRDLLPRSWGNTHPPTGPSSLVAAAPGIVAGRTAKTDQAIGLHIFEAGLAHQHGKTGALRTSLGRPTSLAADRNGGKDGGHVGRITRDSSGRSGRGRPSHD